MSTQSTLTKSQKIASKITIAKKLHRQVAKELSEIEQKLTENGAVLIGVVGFDSLGFRSRSDGERMTKLLKHLDDSHEQKQKRKLKHLLKETEAMEQKIDDLEQWEQKIDDLELWLD
jgi:hypothetical protein